MKRQTLIAAVAGSTLLAVPVVGVLVASTGGAGATQSSVSAFMANCLRLTPGATGAKLAFRERECRTREHAAASVNIARDIERKAQLRSTVGHHAETAAAPTRLTGLVVDRQGPVGTGQVFRATSHWAGLVDNQWVLVYAGAAADPQTGQDTRSELRIYREPANLSSGAANVLTGEEVPPGGGTAPLTITSAAGSVLTVRASSGASVPFDVAQRAFSTE